MAFIDCCNAAAMDGSVGLSGRMTLAHVLDLNETVGSAKSRWKCCSLMFSA